MSEKQDHIEQDQTTDDNYDKPEIVGEKCALYIVGHLSQTLEGNRYVMTFQDELSKYTLAVSIKQQDAMAVATAFVEEVF